MPTSVEHVAEAHAKHQKRLAQRAATEAAKFWKSVDSRNIGESWRAMLPQIVRLMATAQATAAASAGVYLDDALDAQGISTASEGRLIATAFGRSASDGRSLPGLMFQPAVQTLTAIRSGSTVDRAKALGQLSLDKVVRTQVADAGRGGESVGMATRPAVQGYVRMLSLPSCSRCIILAGRFYRWNTGFRRHPRCDCRHIPSRENVSGDLTTNPRAAFDNMSAAEQDRVFTKAGAEALRDGADLNKVVNARRGTETATVSGRQIAVTREAAGRSIRLMPEQIYIEAKGSRSEAIRILRLHGYIQ